MIEELVSQVGAEDCGVDVSRFPLLISTTAGGVTDERLEKQFELLEQIFYTREEPYVNIIDARFGPPLGTRDSP